MSYDYDCDPSGEGCDNCIRYMDDCDGKDYDIKYVNGKVVKEWI